MHFVGSHLFVVMNFSPNSLNAGIDPPARENTIPAATIRINSDAMKRTVFVSLSLFIQLSLFIIGFPSNVTVLSIPFARDDTSPGRGA